MRYLKYLVVFILLNALCCCVYTIREYATGNEDNCTFIMKSYFTRVEYKGKDREISMHKKPAESGTNPFWKLLGLASYPLGMWAGKPDYEEVTELPGGD